MSGFGSTHPIASSKWIGTQEAEFIKQTSGKVSEGNVLVYHHSTRACTDFPSLLSDSTDDGSHASPREAFRADAAISKSKVERSPAN